MTEFREDLMNRMIHIYGLENPIVIQFAQMYESDNNSWNDMTLQILVEAHEASPFFDED